MPNSSSSNRISPVLGSVIFFFVAPFMVAGVIPYWLSGWSDCCSDFAELGFPLVAVGAMVLFDSIRRFALEGLGTPAPIYPTRTLVVSGLYQYVRNPMYLAVLLIIFGQALIFEQLALGIYGLSVWLVFDLFIRFYEEPKLKATYGEQYEQYRRRVRRWIPSR